MTWTKVLGGAALAAGMFAGPTLAADPPKPAPPGATVSELEVVATKMVSELTVTAKIKCLPPQGGLRRERPKVVDVFPARGAAVRPGLLVVRVTFDQPMACEGAFDAVPSLPNPCPGAVRDMLLSYDRKTVRTVCLVEPGKHYGYSLGEDPNAKTFIGLAGLPTESARVAFSTTEGPLVTDVCQALAQDPVTAAQLRDRGTTCETPKVGG